MNIIFKFLEPKDAVDKAAGHNHDLRIFINGELSMLYICKKCKMLARIKKRGGGLFSTCCIFNEKCNRNENKTFVQLNKFL